MIRLLLATAAAAAPAPIQADGLESLRWAPGPGILLAAEGGLDAGVYLIPRPGAGRRLLVRAAYADLAWSPDGKRIVARANGRLITMNPDGGARRVVARLAVRPLSLWWLTRGITYRDIRYAYRIDAPGVPAGSTVTHSARPDRHGRPTRRRSRSGAASTSAGAFACARGCTSPA